MNIIWVELPRQLACTGIGEKMLCWDEILIILVLHDDFAIVHTVVISSGGGVGIVAYRWHI